MLGIFFDTKTTEQSHIPANELARELNQRAELQTKLDKLSTSKVATNSSEIQEDSSYAQQLNGLIFNQDDLKQKARIRVLVGQWVAEAPG